jgi:hypothetical protein
MLRAGVSLKIASDRLGHSGIGITADLYQHVASDMDADTAERAALAMRVGGSSKACVLTRDGITGQRRCAMQSDCSICAFEVRVPANN